MCIRDRRNADPLKSLLHQAGLKPFAPAHFRISQIVPNLHSPEISGTGAQFQIYSGSRPLYPGAAAGVPDDFTEVLVCGYLNPGAVLITAFSVFHFIGGRQRRCV